MRCRLPGLVAALLLSLLLPACSYTRKVEPVWQATARGDAQTALQALSRPLRAEPDEVPPDLGGHRLPLLLERAVLQHALGEHGHSARDLLLADQRLLWLEVSARDGQRAGRHLLSDEVGAYRAPAYERLMLHALNMLNFLALDDLEGARVEARRWRLVEDHLLHDEERAVLPALRGLGNVLAGAVFEASGEEGEAADFHARAWAAGLRDDGLRERLVDLLRLTGRPVHPEVQPLWKEAQQAGPLTLAEYRRAHARDRALVVVQTGLVPHREPRRMSLREALDLAGAEVSDSTRQTLQELESQGTLHPISVPVLAHGPTTEPAVVRVAGGQPLAPAVDVGQQVSAAWEAQLPALTGAALTRVATRGAAGTAVRKGGGDRSWAAPLGTALQAGLSVADRADTRGWSTLPATVHLAWVELPADEASLRVEVGGQAAEVTAAGRPDRLRVASHTRLGP